MNKVWQGIAAAAALLLLLLAVRAELRSSGEQDARTAMAERNGVTVALTAKASREAAARAVAAYRATAAPHTLAKGKTDAAFQRIDSALYTPATSTEIARDTVALVLIGPPIPPLDSLVTLGYVRVVMDTVRLAVLAERAAAQLRLDKADAAIDSLTVAVNAQAALVANRDDIIKALKAERPGFVRRAVRGLETATAGALCGGVGWLGGPLVGVASAGVCIIVVETVR